jgi:hypothetical protein
MNEQATLLVIRTTTPFREYGLPPMTEPISTERDGKDGHPTAKRVMEDS